jgi:hypothetical protein
METLAQLTDLKINEDGFITGKPIRMGQTEKEQQKEKAAGDVPGAKNPGSDSKPEKPEMVYLGYNVV